MAESYAVVSCALASGLVLDVARPTADDLNAREFVSIIAGDQRVSAAFWRDWSDQNPAHPAVTAGLLGGYIVEPQEG